MPNWNAYKVFANGKRAKSPYTTFESDESNHFSRVFYPLSNQSFRSASGLS